MSNHEVLTRLLRLYKEVLLHEGYGEVRVEVKLLKKGQKEVILHCGKQFRFVVDHTDRQALEACIEFLDRQPRGLAAGG